MPFPQRPQPINWGSDDPLSWENLMAAQLPAQQAAQHSVDQTGHVSLPGLDPQEEESMLSSIGHKTLGGIGAVGNFLDKYTGGRAVRGLLGGKPEEALSLLPFSDALGITDENNRVSGRDLTDNLGFSTKGSDSLGDTLLGVGADILTNPTTYLGNFGSALTPAGKVAAKIGALPNLSGRLKGFSSLSEITPAATAAAGRMGVNLNDIVGKPLGGLAEIGLPFLPKMILGEGQAGANALATAGKAARTVADLPGINQITHPLESAYNTFGKPVVRHLNALFNHEVAGATSEGGQQAGKVYTKGLASGLEGVRGVQAQAIRTLEGAGALDKPDVIRGVAEAAQGAASPIGAQGQAVNQAVGGMIGHLDSLDAAGAEMGFTPKILQDTEANYFPSFEQQLDKNSRGYGGMGTHVPTEQSALSAREDVLRNIPRGRLGLNELSTDPEISGVLGTYGPAHHWAAGQAPTTPLEREALVRARYLGVSPEDEARIGTVLATRDAMQKASTQAAEAQKLAGQLNATAAASRSPVDLVAAQRATDEAQRLAVEATKYTLSPSDELLVSRWEQSKPLTRWAESLDPLRAHGDSPVPFFGRHPIDDYATAAAAKIRRNEAGNAIHGLFAETAVDAAHAGPGYVPLAKAYTSAGFDDPVAALQFHAKKTGVPLTPTTGLDRYVPPEAVKDANTFVKGFQTPQTLKPLIGAIDWVTKLTKTMQTAPWLNFHVRNFTSGQFANAMLGAGDPRYSAVNVLHYIAPVMDAMKVLKGEAMEGASSLPIFAGKGMSDIQATKALADLAYVHGAAGQGASLASEGMSAAEQAQSLASKIPGLQPYEGFWENTKAYFPKTRQQANPLNVAGVNSNVDLFAPAVAGRRLGNMTEEVNRLSSFIGQLRQGMDPAAAAMRTRAAHIDYSALSPFEKNVMRRVIPFYSYTRGIVPFVMDNIARNPGGLAGTTAMASAEVRNGNKSFVPDYLGNGMALPWGKEENGQQRFLTKIDNPVEAAASIYNGGGLGDTMMGLLGQTNPLIKAPLEYATGKQFFTGRDLADLYPMTGNTLTDQVIMNSPASRLATTYRTLTDERKLENPAALITNLLTGVRMSDVDMQKQRELAARDYISQNLKGHQGIGRYETIYPRADTIGQLSPEEIALLRLNKTLEQQAAARSKAEKGTRIGLRGH